MSTTDDEGNDKLKIPLIQIETSLLSHIYAVATVATKELIF